MTDDESAARDAAGRFWDYAVAVYGVPDVAAACLALQDDLGLDVNLLLFCCWAGAEGAPGLTDGDLARAVAAIQPWRERAVSPLRNIRRDLKDPVGGLEDVRREAFRQHVAALELEAERVAQGMLTRAVPLRSDGGCDLDQRLAAAAKNVIGYLTVAGIEPDAVPRTHLTVILGAAVEVSSGRAIAAIEAAIRSRAAGHAIL